MKVDFDNNTKEYVIKERLSNGQTLHMGFEPYEKTDYGVYYNVYVSVYNKRKHKYADEDAKKITGTSPLEAAIIGMKAFDMLEKTVIEENDETINIVVWWVDNRRRNAYYSFLKKRGYNFCNCGGKKVLLKHIEK